MASIKEIISSQMAINELVVKPRATIPIEQVDQLADEIALEYNNPKFRSWYCGVIQDFGVERVYEWRRRSAEGDIPARLFSHYVKSARKLNNDN